MDCVFCKIANKELESATVYEDDKFIAFNDTNPVAPVHILVIPKKHIPSVNSLEEQDKEMVGELFLIAKQIAKEKELTEKGYRLTFNVGRGAGQTVDHLHLHLLGGEKLPWP